MGIFDRIKSGLQKTRNAFSGRMDELVESYKELDDDFYEDLTDILIMADVGVPTSELAVGRLKEKCKAEKIGNPQKAREELKKILTDILWAEPMQLSSPMVLLIIGVNGVGKTTSIAKLAHMLKNEGKSVLLVAADTFRAAASEQLTIWSERVGVPIIKHKEGADPSAVIFDGCNAAKARGVDVVICDTAGRLQNKKNLMAELSKMNKVIDREFEGAARETLLVVDATTGKNAVSQAREFNEVAELTGIILTKLDGTAKGGIVVTIADELDLPVKYIGLGEGMDDLKPFDPESFAEDIFEG